MGSKSSENNVVYEKLKPTCVPYAYIFCIVLHLQEFVLYKYVLTWYTSFGQNHMTTYYKNSAHNMIRPLEIRGYQVT